MQRANIIVVGTGVAVVNLVILALSGVYVADLAAAHRDPHGAVRHHRLVRGAVFPYHPGGALPQDRTDTGDGTGRRHPRVPEDRIIDLDPTFLDGTFDVRLALALGVVLVGGVVLGFSGFGTGLIFVALLSLIYSPREAVALLMIMGTLGS